MLGDPVEAARRAGYPARGAGKMAAALLRKKPVLGEIARYGASLRGGSPANQAAQGLWRIALGNVNDAVALLARDGECSPAKISRMDLFCVSEIKRPKGGGMEIKFYDKLKALELLQAHPPGDGEGVSSLYGALEQGARSLSESGAVDGDAL
jgi:hypothetical protein